MTFESDDKTVFAPAAGATGDSLSIKLADGRTFEFEISGARVMIGRALESDLVLEDAGVSRRHALITRQAEALVIEDQGSSNGVVVNGRTVQRMELEDGDEITLGGCALKVARAQAQEFEDRTVVSNASAGPKKANGAGKAPGKGKKLILVGGVAGLVILLLIILVASMGGDGTSGKQPAAKPAETAKPAADKPAKAEQTKQAAPEKKEAKPEQPKAGSEKPEADTQKAEAKPEPEQAKVNEEDKAAAAGHVAQGRILQEADRLLEAKKEYARAVELDPGNKLAKSRLASVSGMIKQQAQDAYARGLKNFGFLKYQEAIHDWVQVLNLVPEEDDPLHQKAAEYIEKAKKSMKQ